MWILIYNNSISSTIHWKFYCRTKWNSKIERMAKPRQPLLRYPYRDSMINYEFLKKKKYGNYYPVSTFHNITHKREKVYVTRKIFYSRKYTSYNSHLRTRFTTVYVTITVIDMHYVFICSINTNGLKWFEICRHTFISQVLIRN